MQSPSIVLKSGQQIRSIAYEASGRDEARVTLDVAEDASFARINYADLTPSEALTLAALLITNAARAMS